MQLAPHGAVDHQVAGADHYSADKTGILFGTDLDVSSQTFLQNVGQRLFLHFVQNICGADFYLDCPLMFAPELLVENGDFR